jgi:hypothetical protein
VCLLVERQKRTRKPEASGTEKWCLDFVTRTDKDEYSLDGMPCEVVWLKIDKAATNHENHTHR